MICKYCNGTGTSNTCVNGTFKSCAACNGTGEEKIITNFDRITASPEALAEFIANIPDKLINPLYGVPTVKRVLPWLKEESEE